MQEHRNVIRKLFDSKDPEILFSTHAKVVKIETTDRKTVLGVLVNNSIAIPLSASEETDYNIKVIVGANLASLELGSHQKTAQATCHLLGLPFNGLTNGFYSDANAINSVSFVHIHPEGFFSSQDEFLTQLTDTLKTKGLTLTIKE